MNEKFEQDETIQSLRKAAKAVRAPKLSESILESASSRPTKANWREKLALASQRSRVSLMGAAAVVAVAALSVPVLQAPSGNIRITLGSAASSESGLSDQTQPGSSKMGSSALWYGNVDYVAGSELSTDSGSGDVYRVEPSSTPAEMAALLKELFEVKGKVTFGDNAGGRVSDYGDGFSSSEGGPVTADANLNNGGKSIYVSTQGATYFSYYNANAYKLGDCIKWDNAKVALDEFGNPSEAAEPTPENTRYCVENEFVEPSFLSESAAKAEAASTFKALGLDVASDDINIEIMTDVMYANAQVKLNGKPTGLVWDISWGNTGEIYTVSGSAVTFTKVGSVGTISDATAVERLSDYRWAVSADSTFWAKSAVYPYDEAGHQGKATTVAINKALATMGTITDASGGMWIVPSVVLYSKFGMAGVVTTVADGVIQMPSDRPVPLGEIAR
jgi:hypothetical protein